MATSRPLPTSRFFGSQAALVQQWLALDQGVKQQIKQSLLTTLGAQVGWQAGKRSARICRTC